MSVTRTRIVKQTCTVVGCGQTYTEERRKNEVGLYTGSRGYCDEHFAEVSENVRLAKQGVKFIPRRDLFDQREPA